MSSGTMVTILQWCHGHHPTVVSWSPSCLTRVSVCCFSRVSEPESCGYSLSVVSRKIDRYTQLSKEKNFVVPIIHYLYKYNLIICFLFVLFSIPYTTVTKEQYFWNFFQKKYLNYLFKNQEISNNNIDWVWKEED